MLAAYIYKGRDNALRALRRVAARRADHLASTQGPAERGPWSRGRGVRRRIWVARRYRQLEEQRAEQAVHERHEPDL